MSGPKQAKSKAMSLAFVLLDFQHAGVRKERSIRDGV